MSGQVGFPYFGQLILDCINRTENAMTQDHAPESGGAVCEGPDAGAEGEITVTIWMARKVAGCIPLAG